jgi:ATP:ADP antiporter, AAA family
VCADNKLLDLFPKHHLFYMMGLAYAVLFTVMGLLLMHPTIGLANADSSPYRLLGWISYCTIESFGSMVVQCYWALVNASVDMPFAKKNFGLIVAGAQIGSILGPTVAMNANSVGIPALYLFGAVVMFMMVGAMYLYMERFGVALETPAESSSSASSSASSASKKPKGDGVMEGFYLFWDNDFVKGIFAISAASMVQVTILDYTMKVLVKTRYDSLYPDDPQAAVRAFAAFMGFFGQMTNTISFLFSLLGTGFVIKRFGLTNTMISYPVLLLACAVLVYVWPSLWVVFTVMMLLKGMSYALNNPCKEILYQVTNSQIKFKCKSWIDTFGQRSAKAGGSIVTNAFATSLPDLVAYGSLTGVAFSVFLIWVSIFMGK